MGSKSVLTEAKERGGFSHVPLYGQSEHASSEVVYQAASALLSLVKSKNTHEFLTLIKSLTEYDSTLSLSAPILTVNTRSEIFAIQLMYDAPLCQYV